jgi:hypothetical protein
MLISLNPLTIIDEQLYQQFGIGNTAAHSIFDDAAASIKWFRTGSEQ